MEAFHENPSESSDSDRDFVFDGDLSDTEHEEEVDLNDMIFNFPDEILEPEEAFMYQREFDPEDDDDAEGD